MSALFVHLTAAPGCAAGVAVPGSTGVPAATFRVRRDGDALHVTASGTDRPVTVRVADGNKTEGEGRVPFG